MTGRYFHLLEFVSWMNGRAQEVLAGCIKIKYYSLVYWMCIEKSMCAKFLLSGTRAMHPPAIDVWDDAAANVSLQDIFPR